MQLAESYLITQGERTAEFEVLHVRKSGAVVLAERSTSNEIAFTAVQFNALHAAGDIVAHDPRNRCPRIERLMMMAPDSSKRLREAGWLSEAKTELYFVQKFDEEAWFAKSDSVLEVLIKRHKAEAHARGLIWEPIMHRRGERREWPHPSSLRRALSHGEPHHRSLAELYNSRGLHSKGETWDPFIVRLRDNVIERFWAKGHLNVKIATAMFMRPALAEQRRRRAEYDVEMHIPHSETFRRWLHSSISRERVATKYGAKAARQLCDGHTIGMQALRPLHIVQVDHTLGDTKLIIRDRAGKIIAKKRAYFIAIVDVFSRAFLAAILSFEPPSLESLAAAVKQMIRPKTFLLDEFYGGHSWAADIHGQAKIIVLDNGMEAMRGSFQLSCDMVGMDMDIAPLGTPTYKPLIERAIEATNQGFFHLAPGAIPFKPHLMSRYEASPDMEAEWTLEAANRMLWKFITTQHHMDVNSSIKMPPALKWQDGTAESGRTVSDHEIHYVDCAFGQKKQDVTLTNGGAKVKGFTFGDGNVVSQLLEDLLVASNHKFRRGKIPAKGKAKIDAIWYADDCSYISVYNPKRNRYVRLLNRDPLYRENPCSWKLAKAIEKFFEDRNEKFETPEKRYARIIEYAEHLERTISQPKKPETRHDYRKYQQLRDSTLLGANVEVVHSDPTPNGNSRVDIPVVMPGRELRGEVQISKRPRVGGKAATQKGMETKRRNQFSSNRIDVQTSAPFDREVGPIIEGVIVPHQEITDFDAFMKGIMADLD